MNSYQKLIRSSKCQDYETPPEPIKLITNYLDRDLRIWDPFFSSGRVAQTWKDLGYDILHEDKDFFQYTEYPDGIDAIITNPPYKNFDQIFKFLMKMDKPWAALIPVTKLGCKYFQHTEGLYCIFFSNVKWFKNGVQFKETNPMKFCWLCFKIPGVQQNYFDYL